MPFQKAQSIIKKVLPKSCFDKLYDFACNRYDNYVHFRDRTFFIFPFVKAWLSGDTLQMHRIITIQRALPYTMVSKIGVEKTYNIARMAIDNHVNGAFVECGVARGGCALVLAEIAKFYNRKTWLFDSFEGLPPQSEKDGKQKPIRHKDRKANDLAQGYCLGTYDEVRKMLFDKYKLDKDNVLLVKGWFENTLPNWKHDIGDIAVLRLDGDWYESTKCCLENLYPYVVKNGFVIIDDYQLHGCKLAVDEFIYNNNLNVNLISDANGRCYWRK